VLVDAGAAWRIGRRLQIVASGRNLLNASYHANPGPRWVYAPGAHGSLSLVVAF
jgi:hypothetical protein